MAMHRTAWRPVSVRLPPETAKKRPFAREISHFLPGILTTIIITSNVFCVYDNSVMPEELMTGSNRGRLRKRNLWSLPFLQHRF